MKPQEDSPLINLETGRWPRQGANESDILQTIRHQMRQDVSWGRDVILGFPSMNPDQLGMKVFHEVSEAHNNAILTHTRGRGEKGFEGMSLIERDLIRKVGHLIGDNNVDGYVTSGGTEANIMGLWIAREFLREEVKVEDDSRVAVLASSISHYSLRKACALLDMGEGSWHGHGRWRHFRPNANGSGLNLVEATIDGSINVAALEKKIYELRHSLMMSRFVIFLNAGSTLTGSVDDVEAVVQLVRKLKNEWGSGVGFYIHVDAAYGGFIIPFLYPDLKWALHWPEVMSVTLDPYKMGRGPMAQGLFLCRKPDPDKDSDGKGGLQRYIQRQTGYVNDEYDDTLIGSRSAAMAAACWTVFHRMGTEGFQTLHQSSAARARKLARELDGCAVRVLCNNLNMVTLELPDAWDDDKMNRFCHDVVHPRRMMSDWFYRYPDPSPVPAARLVKFNITPDVDDAWLYGSEQYQGVVDAIRSFA